MKPVSVSVSPENAFYKRTPAEWAEYLGREYVDLGHDEKITRKQYLEAVEDCTFMPADQFDALDAPQIAPNLEELAIKPRRFARESWVADWLLSNPLD